MFIFSILIALVIGAVFILLIRLQWRKMIDESGLTLGMYITMNYSPNLRFSDKFSNITSNIILKFVIFVIVATILHFTKFHAISTIYGIAYFALEVFKLSTRLREYKMNQPMRDSERNIDKCSKTAYIFLFIYTIVLIALMYTV